MSVQVVSLDSLVVPALLVALTAKNSDIWSACV